MLDHAVFEAGEMYSVAQKYATANPQFTPQQEEENDLNSTFDGRVTGWDNQTGLIMDVDYDGTPMAGQSTLLAMPSNHLTYVGNEYDYTRPDVNGNANENGTDTNQTDNSQSQTFGQETPTMDYTGTTLPSVYTAAGFKVSVIPFYDMNDNFRGRIAGALDNGDRGHFLTWCHQAFKTYTAPPFGAPQKALLHTMNGGPNIFKIEYQGTPSPDLRITLEAHWPDSTPDKFYTIDSNIPIVAFDMWLTQPYHEVISNVTYVMWRGGIHMDLVPPANIREITGNWKVFNQNVPTEFGVTGYLPHQNLN